MFPQIVLVCTCEHHKRRHLSTKQTPRGSCADCSCTAFTPEPKCKCGHGKKAHSKGRCHEGDGCKEFRPA